MSQHTAQSIHGRTVDLDSIRAWLNRHSIDILRVALGAVFLGFGALKFFPGVSPAEGLAVDTVETLTLGLVGGQTALLVTASLETLIGLTLVTGRFVRIGLSLLAVALLGILSPVVLFFGQMFPDGGPTLQAQYVLKDVVLVAAGLVVAASELGGRLTD
jgi:putative oxidoreductase